MKGACWRGARFFYACGRAFAVTCAVGELEDKFLEKKRKKILKERVEKREKHGNSGKRVPKKAKEKKKKRNFPKKLWLGYRQGGGNVVDYFSPANERRRESSLSAEPVAGRKD
ncbi:MAG: hypothetical protein SOT81_06555, partial [Treponema sp.]|nr:hypothetical protein [Treponema sp.]